MTLKYTSLGRRGGIFFKCSKLILLVTEELRETPSMSFLVSQERRKKDEGEIKPNWLCSGLGLGFGLRLTNRGPPLPLQDWADKSRVWGETCR